MIDLLEVQRDDSRFRQFLDGEPDAFATDAAPLDAAERHRVETVIGRIVYDHHAGGETSHRCKCIPQALGEDRGMEAVVGTIGNIRPFSASITPVLSPSSALARPTVRIRLPSAADDLNRHFRFDVRTRRHRTPRRGTRTKILIASHPPELRTIELESTLDVSISSTFLPHIARIALLFAVFLT
jgi:hypothetical protein